MPEELKLHILSFGHCLGSTLTHSTHIPRTRTHSHAYTRIHVHTHMLVWENAGYVDYRLVRRLLWFAGAGG